MYRQGMQLIQQLQEENGQMKGMMQDMMSELTGSIKRLASIAVCEAQRDMRVQDRRLQQLEPNAASSQATRRSARRLL